MDENRNTAAISEKLQAVLSNPGAFQALLDTARSAMPMQQAACIVAILPILILFLISQRFFAKSVERSGIVG